MTPAADGYGAMRRPLPLDDEVTERLLAGRPHGDLGDLTDLAMLLEEVRSLTRGPAPPPSSALAEILTNGAPAGRPPAQDPMPSPLSTRHRRRGAVWASLTAVAAAVILAVAGTLDVLPRPAQRMVATAVSAVTPFNLPDDTHETSPDRKGRPGARRAPGTTTPPGAGGRSEVRPPAPTKKGESAADGMAPPHTGASGLNENSQRPPPTAPPSSTSASSSPGRSAPATSAPVTTAPASTASVTTNPPPAGDSVSSVDRRSATLTGAAVRPGPGDPDGAGSAFLELNAGTGQLCLTLTLPAGAQPTVVHIHRAPHGQTGPVVLAVPPPAEAGPPAPVCVPVTSDLLTQFRENPAGHYLQVHTRKFADGALRGQLSS